MHERSIEAALQEIADKEQPHSRISIRQALRDGRARLRRRRVAMVGAPALAAAAALAIALTSAALPIADSRAGPQSGRAPAPRHFSLYSAYARFGWLPTPLARLGTFSTRWDLLQAGPWTLFAGAKGECHVKNREFTCASSPLAAVETSPAPAVDGHDAYWSYLASLPGVPRSVGGLIWQYKSGGWAVVSTGPTRGTPTANKQMLRHIASTVTFGGHHPSLRFAVKLTGLPAGWHTEEASFGPPAGVKLASRFSITNGRETLSVNMGLDSRFSNACSPQHGRIGWSCQVIHGYHVAVSRPVRESYDKPFIQVLTAQNADGLFMEIQVTGRKPTWALSTAALFSDMTMLGNNPADWTSNPIS